MKLPALLIGLGVTLCAFGGGSQHLRKSTTIEQYFDAQTGEVLTHVVSRLVDTESVKIMRIRDVHSQLACWSLTLGKNTHAVTCG